jgi:integrase
MKKTLRKRNGIYHAVIRLKPTDRPFERSLRTRDYEIAQKKINELARQMEREAEGLAIPTKIKESAQRPISKHLDSYLGEKEKEWSSEKYHQLTGDRLKKLIRDCGWSTLRDVDAFSFTQWRSRQALTPKTLNNYLTALNGFLEWLETNGFIETNPANSIKLLKRRGQSFERKALSPEQITALLESVKDPMRRAVYITALYTGLRRAELEALEYGDYNLSAPVPYVHARASTTKNGKDAFIPLHVAVVDALLDILPNNPSPAEPVFKVPSIETFKADLEAAGIDYRDQRGNKTDFHALRTTYCTLMVSTGVAPRVAQELMRHSDIKLTMKNYTDISLLPTAGAIRGLPNFATPVATRKPTLAGIGCPEESGNFEGKTFETPNNKGLCEVASPLVSRGDKWCRRRDSNPHGIATAGF